MCANTLCPLSSSTRNIAFGSGSETVPSISIASFFGKLRVNLSTDTLDTPFGEPKSPPDGSDTQV
jgi:hypothetical protein